MKRYITALLAAAVAGALFVASPLVAMPKGTENYNKSFETAGDCSGDDTMTVLAPEKLWPPNHKYYEDISVTATDGSGQRVDLVTDGTHDQYDGDTEANGSGNTADDIASNDADAVDGPDSTSTHPVAMEGSDTGTVTTDWVARAERAGTIKDARVYTLHATSTSADGDSCEATVQFEVPHDMRKSNR